MTRHQQAVGKAGEDAARLALAAAGYRMIEKVGTPVRLVKHPFLDGFFRVIYGEPVAADFRAIAPGGISVLVEVKTVSKLVWSDFRQHQPGKLSEHEELDGISLVVWVSETGIYIMRWRDMLSAGFGPGKRALTVEKARVIAI